MFTVFNCVSSQPCPQGLFCFSCIRNERITLTKFVFIFNDPWHSSLTSLFNRLDIIDKT